MKIAGFQKLSLLDYPGKISAVIFTHGCNFRCPFCHNPELVLEPFSGQEKDNEILRFLEERKNFLDGVSITGGEPLLQENLSDFMSKLKEQGFSVKLDTNGLLSGKLEEIIKSALADYIAMDIKSSLSHEAYHNASGVAGDIEQIKRSINLIMESGIDYEFRTTVVSGLHSKKDITDIAEYIKGAKKYCLQKFEIRDKILDDKMLNCSSITKKEAMELREECERSVKECELRGWE